MKEHVRGRLYSGLAVLTMALGGAAQADAGAIELRCGGIGVDESTAMRAEAGRHALTLVFASTEGRYLSDVGLRIVDPLNDLEAVSADCGPVAVVDVPAASRYRVTATFGGRTESQWFDLRPGGGATAVMRWALTPPAR